MEELVAAAKVAASAALRLLQTDAARSAGGIAAVYLAVSQLLLMRRPRKDAHVTPASYPIVIGALLAALATYLVGTLSQTVPEGGAAALQPFVYAGIGAVACIVSIMMHHPSTILVVQAVAVMTALADASGWTLTGNHVLLVNGAIFAVAYVVSRPAFVASFGPGVTLFSFAALLPLAAIYYTDTAQRTTALSAAALAATPFLLMLTGHPEYLHKQPHYRTLLSCTGGAYLIAGTAALHAGSTPLLLAAGVCFAVTVVLAYVDVALPPVLGPFYSYERRSSVLSIICITLVSLQLASVQDAAALPSSSSSPGGGTPGSWGSFVGTVGPHLPALLLVVTGYAATVLAAGAFVVAIAAVGPATASAFRATCWDLGLTIVLLTAGSGVLLQYTSLPATAARAVAAARGLVVLPDLHLNVPAVVAPYVSPLGRLLEWSPAWHVAFAAAVTFGLAVFLFRALSRSTQLFAPIFADVLVRGPPTTRAAALTFSGSPSEDTTPALLALLGARGAKGTFFVTGEDALRLRALVAAIAGAGHEVGLLGAAYPSQWTPWGVGDAISKGLEALGEALAPLAMQAAHAGESARAQALLSAIEARKDGSSSSGSGSGSGVRRRRGSQGPASSSSAGSDDVSSNDGNSASAAAAAPASASAGPTCAWYRPQDGARAANELRAANARGLGVALWSACPYDWDATPEQVRARVSAQLDAQAAGSADATRGAGGAVVTLSTTVPPYLEASKAAHRPAHDVVAAAAAVLDVLRDRGVPVVTLSALSPSCGRAAATELFPT